MNGWTLSWKITRPSFQYSSPVSTKLRLSPDSIWRGTLCRHPPYGHPRYMSGHPYINDMRLLQRLRCKRLSYHALNKTSRPTKTRFKELTKGVTDGYSGHQVPDFDVQLQSQEGSSRMERGFQEGLFAVQKHKTDCL